MKPASLVFRLRVVIFVAIYAAAFALPWNRLTGSGATLWLAASTLLYRGGVGRLEDATVVVTMTALALLICGAALRVSGTAFIGSSRMRGARLESDRLTAAGPYRYLRNPLYLGTWLLGLGTSVLMPLAGAVFFLIAGTAFPLLLVSTEERYLRATAGAAYQQYQRDIPRYFPRLLTRSKVAYLETTPESPRWGQALLAEICPVAFSACFAVLAWRYNAALLTRCLLVCYGVSLVVRALSPDEMLTNQPGSKPTTHTAPQEP